VVEYLRTGEVARALSVVHDTVRQWAKSGRLPASRTPGGQFRFAVADVRALMEELDYPLDRLDRFLIR
jgi:excisionase family DNA binding protein